MVTLPRSRGDARAVFCILVVTAAVLGLVLTVPGSAARGDAPYRSPYDVAFAPDGKRLAVSDHTAGSVSVIDVKARSVASTIELRGRPAALAWSADGSRLFVAERNAGTVAEVAFKGESNEEGGRVERRFSVGPQPVGLAVASKRKLLLVTNFATHAVSVVDLAGGAERARIAASREPFAVAVTPDETLAIVGNLLPAGPATDPTMASVLSIIDLASLKRVGDVKLPPGSTALRGIAISPDGRWVYAVHTVGRFSVPTTQLDRGWVNTNALSVVDLASRTHLATALLDYPSEGAADPWGIALSKDGATAWISLSGVHTVARVDIAGLHKLLAGNLEGKPQLVKSGSYQTGTQNIWMEIKNDPAKRELLVNDLAALYVAGLIKKKPLARRGWWETSPAPERKGPRGIALSPDGTLLACAVYYAGVVWFADPDLAKAGSSLEVGSNPKPDPRRAGEICFHDATLCFQHWLSCATCHPEGRVDALNWDLLNDGIGNPKNSKSLLLSHETPPAMARGVRADMEAASRAGYRHILFREPEEDELRYTTAYLRALKPGRSPYRTDAGGLSPEAQRGKALFESEQTKCATCHKGEFFTDLQSYDVGTRGEYDRVSVFDTPTLIELWRTAPYLHDGAAATVRDVLTTCNKNDRHGSTSQLTATELEELVAYLLSL